MTHTATTAICCIVHLSNANRIPAAVLTALVVTTAPASASAADTGSIQLEMKVQTKKGPVYCALFDNADGFPMKVEKAKAKVRAKVKGTSAVCRFKSLKTGTYAVMAFHDHNGNGKLDTNWLGMPREGVVSSNNAKGNMGPPSFKDASVTVSKDAAVKQSLTLKYY